MTASTNCRALQLLIRIRHAQRLVVDDVHGLGGRVDRILAGEAARAETALAVDRQLLHSAVAKLSPREQDIISLRFGLGGRKELTQKEVADQLGISQSYISRLEKRIIQRLKKEILRLS